MKLPITGSRHFANFLMVCESEWILSAKGLCLCRGSNPHPLDYWDECFTDWATAALLYTRVKLHQVIFNARVL